jgi:hypothetical protein
VHSCIALAALVAFPVAAQPRSYFDVDAAFGAAGTTDEVYGSSAPAVSLRVGIRPLERLSLGIRGEAALGQEGAEVAFTPLAERSGHKWFAGVADVRFILTAPHELFVAVGAGVGHMVSLQCTCEENYAAHGSRKAIVQLGLGTRFEIGPLRPGVEVRALRWANVETRGSVSSPPPPLPPVQTKDLWLVLLTLTLGASM